MKRKAIAFPVAIILTLVAIVFVFSYLTSSLKTHKKAVKLEKNAILKRMAKSFIDFTILKLHLFFPEFEEAYERKSNGDKEGYNYFIYSTLKNDKLLKNLNYAKNLKFLPVKLKINLKSYGDVNNLNMKSTESVEMYTAQLTGSNRYLVQIYIKMYQLNCSDVKWKNYIDNFDTHPSDFLQSFKQRDLLAVLEITSEVLFGKNYE